MPVGIELGSIYKIDVHGIIKPAEFTGIGWGLEVLGITTHKKRLPVFREQVIDEDQVACTPCQDLPTYFVIHIVIESACDICLSHIKIATLINQVAIDICLEFVVKFISVT